MAKSYSSLFILLTAFLFNACQTVEQISLDYMVPAEVSFPTEVRKVAIVNNAIGTPENKLLFEKDTIKGESIEISRAIAYSNGDIQITTEALAKEVANQNYFDQVVICDSALRANDRFTRENTLSQEDVEQLTTDLNVDAIIALENVQMKATKSLYGIRGIDYYRSLVDVKVRPVVSIYLPTRKTRMVAIAYSDSIFWEEEGVTAPEALSRLIPEKQMLKEASEFAGIAPVKRFIPHWEKAERYLFISGSVNMRDAAIYVRKNSWDKAFKLWSEEFQKTKSKKRKMRSALNIALYHEMNDSISEAEVWAKKGQELAYEVDKVKEKLKLREEQFTMPNYVFSSRYLMQLKERSEQLPKLNAQMRRFTNDF